MAISNDSNQTTIIPEAVLPEAEIVKQAQAGDADAFGALYRRHIDAIYRYVQHRVTEPDEAENLTQVVFVKAWQGLPRYQPTKTPFRGWLYRIAGNTVIDYYRTHKETADIEAQRSLADEQPSPEEALLSAERSESVHNAINQLKPSYQQVISLRFLDERDYPETAQVLDRQVNAVRVLQHRALGALQKVLTQEQISWIVTMAAVLTLALGGSVALAAENSLPGDMLYPLKRTAESSLLLVADDSLDLLIHQALAGRRVDEMAELLIAGRHDLLAAPGQAYGEHLTGIVDGLSLLAEQEPDEARQIADSAIQALTRHGATLSAFASADALNYDSALVDSIDAGRQAKVILATIASESQPASEPAPNVGHLESENSKSIPTKPVHTPIRDTESPQKSNGKVPVPPSSETHYSLTEQPVVEAVSRPQSTTTPSEQHSANPTNPKVDGDEDSADVFGTMNRERPPRKGSDLPHQTNAAPIEKQIDAGPIVWPFPTLRPAVSHPSPPLAAPQVSPPQDQSTDSERSPESPDTDPALEPQSPQPGRQTTGPNTQSESVREPQPTQTPVPDSDEPSSTPQAGQSEQMGQLQRPSDPLAEGSNGGNPAHDQTNEQPLNRQDSQEAVSHDSDGDADSEQSGSPSGAGQEAEPSPPADAPDTDDGNGPSGSRRQESSSSPSNGQGRR